jgi:nucleotide-binding universal stress UspA family protein
MDRIVTVGTDGSVGGRRALDWAIRHALSTRATVEVVTAYRPPEVSRAAASARQDLDVHEVLEQFRDAIPRIVQRVVPGDPVDVLIEAAWNSDLLVLGSHGHGQLATTLLGSVSEACVRRGVTPVLIVPARGPVPAAAGQKTRNVPDHCL